MSEEFEPLDEWEVVYIEDNKNLLAELGGLPTISASGLTPSQLARIETNIPPFKGLCLTAGQLAYLIQQNTRMSNTNKKNLFEEGTEAISLKYGAKGWQTGTIRVKITVEFCADEPEDEETPVSNTSEPIEAESPLDDIRRLMKEDNI